MQINTNSMHAIILGCVLRVELFVTSIIANLCKYVGLVESGLLRFGAVVLISLNIFTLLFKTKNPWFGEVGVLS